jgi:hypothetical protein
LSPIWQLLSAEIWLVSQNRLSCREGSHKFNLKPKQEAEVTLRQALASELTDDDLAAIAAGAKDEGAELSLGPKPDPLKLN